MRHKNLVWIMGSSLLTAACGGDDTTEIPGVDEGDSSGFHPATTGFDASTSGSATTTMMPMDGGEVDATSTSTSAGDEAPVSTSQGSASATNTSTTATSVADDDGDGDGNGDGFLGSDGGEPPGPDEGTESCDAGDEAFAKRIVHLVQGRQPESIREIRLLVSMIEQLDALGEDGRLLVARGLARGDLYLERWRRYVYEELRINLAGDRRNDECYSTLSSGAGEGPELAAFIRDNTADADWEGDPFWMPDVVYSGLRLDDMSPIYRADLYARLSAPLIAGNVNQIELEQMRRVNYGGTFEQVYFGRNTECLECHRSEWSVTYSALEEENRHWAVPAYLEAAVYGYGPVQDSVSPMPDRHQAVFRMAGFVEPLYWEDIYIERNGQTYQDNDFNRAINPGDPAFGMGSECGLFHLGDALPSGGVLNTEAYNPYLISDYSGQLGAGNVRRASTYEFDVLFQQGLENLRTDGLQVGADLSVSGPEGAAYMFALNFANRLWTEAMGFPLTVANNFPRNEAQRDIMRDIAEAFINESYSLRAALGAIATHPYFNQAAPAACNTTTPYHMAAVFDPFTKDAADPSARGNGTGDSIHRRGARPLLDALSQTMWWNKPDIFGEDTEDEIPEFNCGGDTPQIPCVAEPADAQLLRDMGAFLSDSESGFEGIDMISLLRLEQTFGAGEDPELHGDCTGPLGALCPGDTDWIDELIAVAAATPEAQMWDVAAAVKDRIITETSIDEGAERAVLESLMGVSLDDTVTSVGVDEAETAARRMAGMLFNSPQFMLEGIAPPDQDPANDPQLIVPGTDTASLCNYLAPLILDNAQDGVSYGYTCSQAGIDIEG